MLAKLPDEPLTARLGQEGKRLRQLALGRQPHLFRPLEPAFRLVERISLDTPVELLDSLLFVIGLLLDQLIVRVKARIFALASVCISLSLQGGGTYSRTVRPALPSNDKQLWMKLIHLDLNAHPPQTAILSVELYAEHGKTGKLQLGLFSPQLPEPLRLDVTLARIRSIVGEDCVGCALLGDRHSPSPLDNFKVTPFSLPSRPDAKAHPVRPRSSVRCIRPAESIQITLREGRPESLFFRGKWYAVEQAYGPWLASGDWWNPGLWSNEQWDLVARSGPGVGGELLCCCIRHDLVQGFWTMVSLYD
jgi:protein ImuB